MHNQQRLTSPSSSPTTGANPTPKPTYPPTAPHDHLQFAGRLPIDKRWSPRQGCRGRLAMPSHFLRREASGRGHEPAPRAAMHLRIAGCLKHALHFAPHGAGMAVTVQVAPLPSQRSVVGIPLVIQVSDCGCGTPNSSRKRQSGGLGPKLISHSIDGWPPPCPQSVASPCTTLFELFLCCSKLTTAESVIV
jgi:hypothetical protein